MTEFFGMRHHAACCGIVRESKPRGEILGTRRLNENSEECTKAANEAASDRASPSSLSSLSLLSDLTRINKSQAPQEFRAFQGSKL